MSGITQRRLFISRTITISIAVALTAAVASVRAADRDPRDTPLPGHTSEAVKAVVAYESAPPHPHAYRIAFLTECVANLYCEARMKALRDAQKKYGFEFKTFDSNFNPQEQLKNVQDAVQQGFDGYLFGPDADIPACKMWKEYLVPTNKPVVTLNRMCGYADYTPGVAATVTIQRQAYYDFHMENAFRLACEGRSPCKGISLSGYAGTDIFQRWNKGVENGLVKYPNVKMVSMREAKFDAAVARQITQDALQANPDLAFVVSQDDDTALGALAAIKAAGRVPGKDVKIFSMGANGRGVKMLAEGQFEESTAEDPYDEAYYGVVALFMAMEGHPVNGYINEAELPRFVDGIGTLLVTPDKLPNFKANW